MHIKTIRYILIIILQLSFKLLNAQEIEAPFHKFTHHPWVDSVFNSLSQEEKIGQLIWINAYANNDIREAIRLNDILKKAGVGGIIFTEGCPERQAEMINYFQTISNVPLFIAVDERYRPGMRLDGMVKLPYWMTLGTIQNDSLIYNVGKFVAYQFKKAGVNSSLAHLSGVNGISMNPRTRDRSFGEDSDIAVKKSLTYLNGLQDNGIITITKYFGISLNDSMMVPITVDDPEPIIKNISQGLKSDQISQEAIDEECRKILAAKYLAGLHHYKAVNSRNLGNQLSTPAIKALARELYANSLTVLVNKENILPVRNLQGLKIATIAINRNKISIFQERILDYYPADTFSVDTFDNNRVNDLINKLNDHNLVIAGVFSNGQSSDSCIAVSPGLSACLERLAETKKTIIIYFGNPSAIDNLTAFNKADGLIVAYEENEYTEDLSAQLIFGGISGNGKLPFAINDAWPSGFGIATLGNIRLSYGLPENAGMLSELLIRKVDSIANIGLNAKAYPGCEIMIARKGCVVFHKTYGFHSFDNRVQVRKDDLFDLASVTKVSSTLAGLMLLDSEGRFSVNNRLGDYLPEFRKTNKGSLLMKDLLAHQAGLKDWIPFWKETVKSDSSFKRNIFSHEFSEKYPLKVANDLYINKNYRKKIFNEIKRSPLGEKKYVYSDLTFIISPGIIEKLTGEKWYDFVTRNIYHKIGAFDIGFNPYLRYPLSRIVPTEYDSLFRRQLLHGTVHDEGAAMLGGISGHAGLFATANDLMKLIELYRRMGNYGGEQIIDKSILEEYTRVQFPENNNRRGLGFDKPLLNNHELSPAEAYPAKSATPQSFGHSGFTGTFVWMDPVYEISYIFLSNRVYPTRNNNLLSDLNIRPYILQAIYDSTDDLRLASKESP